jgi:hypothetical protein
LRRIGCADRNGVAAVLIFNYNVREGTEQKVTFQVPDTCPVTCPLRPYSKGYVRVVNTPYFAVTDAQGRFAIRGVPPGDYLVTVWHEGAGMLPASAGPSEFTISDKGEHQVSFRAAVPQKTSSK